MAKRKKTGKPRPGKPRIVARAKLPTRFGNFEILGIEGRGPSETAVAVVKGNGHHAASKNAPLVRIHSQCLTGDILQLEYSLSKIGKSPHGILLYLPQEGRGIGLMNKLKAYELQDAGMDTVEANRELGFAADSRDYRFSAEILKLLGARRVRLLSNNPDKVKQLEDAGIHIAERVPCQPRTSNSSRAYLRTKKQKLGHILAGL